jgi:hypothetical protein
MANFAVIDGINIINKVIADSKEIAEQATGKVCVQYSNTDVVDIGGTYVNGEFIPIPGLRELPE